MRRRDFLKNMGIAGAFTAVPAESLLAGSRTDAPGIVKGKVAAGNKQGILGAVVSDGYTVTATDRHGNYRFVLHPAAEFVFLSLPSGYHIPHENGLARCYQPINNQQITQTIDFVLKQNELDDHKHAFIIWADTQIIKDKDAVKLITVSAPDTAEHIRSLGNIPVHGITVGDLVHDRFDLFDEYSKAVSVTGVPFFQVIGNHDMDYTARTDNQSQNTFKSFFGPTYYSFNRGKIHYITLDNVFYIGKGRSFIGYLPEEQLKWLERDLKYVPEGSTVVINMHIPTNTGEKARSMLREELMSNVLINREHLYKLLKPYTVHFMSGHTHWNEKWEKDNMTEHNHGTVCGAWWTEQNLAMDGTPNGYAIYIVEGSEIKWHYKSVGFTEDYQIKVYPVGRSLEKPQSIVANVWNFDSKWKVEWLEDGKLKGNMEQFTGEDPDVVKHYVKSYKRPTDHLFSATPSPSAQEIIVRATDRFGKTYEAKIKV